MYYYAKTKEQLHYYLQDPKFITKEVWGAKPKSKDYNKGTWKIMGFYKGT